MDTVGKVQQFFVNNKCTISFEQVTSGVSRGGALGAEAPRTRGPEKKKEEEKKKGKKERNGEREGKKESKPVIMKNIWAPYPRLMDFKYPAMGPYVGRPNNFRFVCGG